MKRIKKIILFVLCLFATQIYAAPSVEYSTKSPINGDVKITIKLDKDATLPASSGWKLVRPPEVKLKYNPTTQGYFKVFQGNINKINDGILERDEYGIKWVNSRSLYLNFNQKVDISKVIFYNKSSNYHTFENIGAWDRIRGSIFSFNDWSNKTLYSFKFPAKNNHRIIYIDPKKYVENIKNIQLWFKGSYQNMNEIEVYGHIHTKKEYTKTVSVNESGKVEFTEEGPQAKKINIYYSVSNIDKTKPTITLNGTNPQKVERATSYTEAGFNCTDNVSCTKKTTGSVDVNKIGNYTITYTATDPAGNITTKTRAVIVEDTKDYTVTFNTNGGKYNYYKNNKV